jgi:hypothetical protein
VLWNGWKKLYVLDVESTPYWEIPEGFTSANITFSISPPAVVEQIVIYPRQEKLYQGCPAENCCYIPKFTTSLTLECSLSRPQVSHDSQFQSQPINAPFQLLGQDKGAKYPCNSLRIEFSIAVHRQAYGIKVGIVQRIQGIGFYFAKPEPSKTIIAQDKARLSLLQDLGKSLRKDCSFADVSIEADGQIFKAHKAILANSSPVFHAMFTSQMSESVECTVRPGGALSAGAVCLFLEYLYIRDSQRVLPTQADRAVVVIELFELAEMYQVQDLAGLCVAWMVRFLGVSTVIEILRTAHVHGKAKLKTECMSFIQRESAALFCSRQDIHKWFELTTEHPDLFDSLAKHLKVGCRFPFLWNAWRRFIRAAHAALTRAPFPEYLMHLAGLKHIGSGGRARIGQEGTATEARSRK